MIIKERLRLFTGAGNNNKLTEEGRKSAEILKKQSKKKREGNYVKIRQKREKCLRITAKNQTA